MQQIKRYMMKEKKISRIIAFGDSQTYGYFLTKENNGYGDGPNSNSWPSIVSTYFSIDLVNNGICGASNKEIWLEAINFNYKKGDIVCILWSFFDRDFYPTGNTREKIIGFKGHFEGVKMIPNYYNDKKNKIYYNEIHTNFNSLLSFKLFKTHLAFYLNNLNIPYVFKNLTVPNIPNIDFNWDKIKCTGVNYFLNDYAYDNSHYGPKSHDVIAKKFIEDINEQIC